MSGSRPVSRAFERDESVAIRTEWIRLDQCLKLAQWVQGGGEAKIRIQEGEATVNGILELRRGRKLRVGDVVEFAGRTCRVVAGT